jgi:hypothetical protein
LTRHATGNTRDVTVLPGLASLVAAADAPDDRLLGQLVGANVGALLVLLAYLRRLRAARRGRELEQHFMYRAAPVYYASGWLLVIGFAIALIRGDAPSAAAVGSFLAFLGLWIGNGLVLRADRKIELDDGAGRRRSSTK